MADAPSTPDPAPPAGIDTTVPSPARLYDYYLGGKNNYAVDRELGDRIMQSLPETRQSAVANRLFLGRAVDFLCEQGIDQFIDIGSGLPTQDPVHEVARRHHSGARVVYVDYDPAVRVHAEALLADDPELTGVVQHDMRDPEGLYGRPQLTARIDPDRPVGLLMLALLHFVTDDQNPYDLVRRHLEHLAPGSYLVISHAESDSHPDRAEYASQEYRSSSANLRVRTQDEIRAFFSDVSPVPPGVVHLSDWRPRDDQPHYTSQQVSGLAGVARWDGPPERG
ncbi:SAM-dependent methyltransferase [Streptomonospora wellingtoniae]|uniref:SAM-dependent methyltransferase n=1 Tax=Streptomonospora wellingtoniae TaxID=3075544 RepID=A0ABU2KQ31_9ACTN|nr:SAM-dependent methyltransferase [Streptomonospora sp. DSM 45055]MDT0301397.1 SAM-dependent methyltransferase [Streptomonospora sp. DSM 45055]